MLLLTGHAGQCHVGSLAYSQAAVPSPASVFHLFVSTISPLHDVARSHELHPWVRYMQP